MGQTNFVAVSTEEKRPKHKEFSELLGVLWFDRIIIIWAEVRERNLSLGKQNEINTPFLISGWKQNRRMCEPHS